MNQYEMVRILMSKLVRTTIVLAPDLHTAAVKMAEARAFGKRPNLSQLISELIHEKHAAARPPASKKQR